MKITKSELKEMIREALREELLSQKQLIESAIPMDWEDLIAEADRLLGELCAKSGNSDEDDGDGYWEEEYTTWRMRNLYYGRLDNIAKLEKLCDEYSKKLPNVEFSFFDDDENEISEIGYTATRDED